MATNELLADVLPTTYESIPASEDEAETSEEDSIDKPFVLLELPVWEIASVLSLAFSYGCIMTTLFLITLPVECERIETQHGIPKSVALGIFVALSGASNLVTPLMGMLSDTYRPPRHFELGQRMPYFVFGSILSTVGLLGQYIESYEKLWLRYGVFYFSTMIGLNISYAMMLAIIPDQIPKTQTGTANGVLALLLVLGSLFGFGLFHVFFSTRVQDMYGLYVCVVILTTILTALHGHDRDAMLHHQRGMIIKRQPGERRSKRRIILGPIILLKTMLYDPVRRLNRTSLAATYSIDIDRHHDFFVVTVSRLCYYCGGSVQAFFLYFLHDIIRVQDDAESGVAYLAVLGQISGALICYPVGFSSDHIFGGRRKPFVYVACAILGAVTFAMMFAGTMHDMVILCLIFGAGNGIYLTMETSLAVDTLPEHYEDGPNGGHAQLLGSKFLRMQVSRYILAPKHSPIVSVILVWGVAAFLGSALGPMIGK